MKSILLFLFFSVLTLTLFSQNFTESPQPNPFEGVVYGSVAFADVDGDDDLDVLITGLSSSFAFISKLYTNDGAGAFTEMTGTPFGGVGGSSIAFADVDGDNDQDVLITGRINSSTLSSKLYTNNGTGTFTEMAGTPFEGVENGSIAFADVNGDNDQDVLITGKGSSGTRISKLYTNNGAGTFTEMTGTPFDGVENGSIAFADVDGDNDQDILITGVNNSFENISKLYKNNGAGTFSITASTPFDGVSDSSIAFADVDGDNDQDILITGVNNSFEKISKLYNNNGAGTFSVTASTPFDGVYDSSIAFADVDGDNDQDVLILGDNNNFEQISKLYTNNGSGTFTEKMGTPFEVVSESAIAFADVDGDNDQDILISGDKGNFEQISKLYINGGASPTTDLIIGVNLTLYPNPSVTGKLYVSYDASEYAVVMVQVYDINGLLLKQHKETAMPGQQIYSLDIATLQSGNYFIELYDGKTKGVAKFTVQ